MTRQGLLWTTLVHNRSFSQTELLVIKCTCLVNLALRVTNMIVPTAFPQSLVIFIVPVLAQLLSCKWTSVPLNLDLKKEKTQGQKLG